MGKEFVITLVITYGLSGLMIYSKSYELNPGLRRFLILLPALAIIFYAIKKYDLFENSLRYGLLSGPIVTVLLIELMNWISIKLKGREFYLHASGSKDMSGLGYPFEKAHFQWTDIVFSLILIASWIGWPLIFVIVLHFIQS
jgi:hypothetical protein